MAVSQYIRYFESDSGDEHDNLSDDDTDEYFDVPTQHSKYINISTTVDASYYGNPMTRLKRRKIINDSVMFKRGKSAARDYRTIMIENIPLNSSLLDIILPDQGDTIISGQLLQTISLTGSLSARIIFKEQRFALEFINLTRHKPLSIKGFTAIIYLVATPTWPNSPPFDSMGFTKATSKTLLIRNVPLDFTEHTIRFWLEAVDCANLLEPPVIERNDSEFSVWFASEAAAKRGFQTLSQNERFRDLEIDYDGNETIASDNVAKSFCGIRLGRKRKNEQKSLNDIIGRSKIKRKRPTSEFSQHGMEEPDLSPDFKSLSSSGKLTSDAAKILDALAVVERHCDIIQHMVGIDLHLMTTDDLRLRHSGAEEAISLIGVAQKQQGLIDCIENLSVQLDRSTLIKKTLDDFYQISTRTLNLVYEYLWTANVQRDYMAVFDRSRAISTIAYYRPVGNNNCVDIFINNVRRTMLLLLNLACDVRGLRRMVTNGVYSKKEQ